MKAGKKSEVIDSVIGTAHWFNTLMGSILRSGEYLMKHGTKDIDDAEMKLWGKRIYDYSKEIIDNSAMIGDIWFTKEDLITELKRTIEKLEKL